MKNDMATKPTVDFADLLPPQFYGKPELRKAYFDFLAQLLSSKFHPEKVLDVGCGTGDLALAFQRISIQSTGMDLNERAILFASKSGKGFLTADIGKKWPIPDNSIDMVVALEVLEHIKDPGHCISEAKRILKPGGIVFMTTPSPVPIVSPLVHFALRRTCDVHINEHGKSWWRKQFVQRGFDHASDLTPAIKEWNVKHGFYWELPYPEKLFLYLGYPGRFLVAALYSSFSCYLTFSKSKQKN